MLSYALGGEKFVKLTVNPFPGGIYYDSGDSALGQNFPLVFPLDCQSPGSRLAPINSI
jgi:hypothetical protein